MKLIVGLGNPEKKYDSTYHNAGFKAVDLLAEELGLSLKKLKHRALYAEMNVNGEKYMIAKPQTYMNLSGVSVAEIVRKYKMNISDIVVVYDDIDIAIGDARYRNEGSTGTHNGMRSIHRELGTTNFKRIRIGIKGDNMRGDLADYVLSSAKGENAERLKIGVEKAKEYLEEFIRLGGEMENSSR